jgi:hypothetical protein
MEKISELNHFKPILAITSKTIKIRIPKYSPPRDVLTGVAKSWRKMVAF